MNQDLKTVLLGPVASLVVLILFTGVWSFADADHDPATDNVQRVIPYEGSIEVDGAPYTGPLDLRFTIYDDADNALWTETYSASGDSGASSDVYAGRFSVLLGEYVNLADTVLDAERIFVGVEISTDDFASSTELVGRQQIGMSPFAIWASGSATFEVANQLNVRGESFFDANARFAGDINMSSGCINMNGAGPGAVAICNTDAGDPDDGIAVRALTNPPTGEPIFRVLSEGGVERLRVEHDGEVEIRNDLNVSGDGADNPGNIDAAGAIASGGNVSVGGDLSVGGHITSMTLSSEYTAVNNHPTDSAEYVNTTMVPTGNSLCYLTRSWGEEIDSGSEIVGCSIDVSGANWRLRARVSSSPDAWASCGARCLTW